ncbi:MAG: RHS repeat protein [Candidatus Schekmanbacteria bacterium]|nr:RHS repeat protein [Candidatus Schekmanbacteria bacterium]
MTTPRGWKTFERVIDANTGLVRSETDPNGDTSNYAHDAPGRRTLTVFPLGESLAVSYGAAEEITRQRVCRCGVACPVAVSL